MNQKKIRRQSPWKVACFDLDGTLVTGVSTCQYLREQMGCGHLTADFDERYAAGLMTAGEIARAESMLYKGRTSDEITRMLSSIPTIQGIEETVGYLKRHGIQVLLTTISWTFASRVFAERFGFHDYSGYVMNYLPDGTLSGETVRECDEFRKRDFVLEYCEARRISMNEVFAVGDSRSDIPLFQSVGHSVAINASAQAIAHATCNIETSDLRDVLPLIPNLP